MSSDQKAERKEPRGTMSGKVLEARSIVALIGEAGIKKGGHGGRCPPTRGKRSVTWKKKSP